MTRSLPDTQLLPFDPEIERTVRHLRQNRRRQQEHFEDFNFAVSVSGDMADQDRTLKQLAAPDLTYQPLGITYPQLEVDFELKSGLLHHMPKFNGLAGEDPHRHLKQFHVVCSTMKPQGVTEDQIKLRAFPFSLEGSAKDWFFYIPHGAVDNWVSMKRLFLEKYFPASRAAAIRKDICGIRQLQGESLYEYWERFKRLCESCPQHQISEQLLIQYFYEGLLAFDRSMIDAASGGALVDKTPVAARALIDNMAENSQQFGSRATAIIRGVNEVSPTESSRVEKKLEELTELMKIFALGQTKQSTPEPVKACGICSCHTHNTDACPQLQEDPTSVAAANVFPGRPQPQGNQQGYNPYSNTYNPGWRDHPNMRWGNSSQPQQQRYVPPQNRQQPPIPQMPISPHPPTPPASTEAPWQEMMKMMIESQRKTEAAMQEMRNEINQLKGSSQQQLASTSQIPSQTIPNPKGNVSAIVLRSGSVLPEVQGTSERVHVEEQSLEPEVKQPEPTQMQQKPVEPVEKPVPLPFPHRVPKPKRPAEAELEKELLETFRRVEVNIPLLDAVKQIPKYAKFLKDLCTNKRKLKGTERINLGVNVSSILTPGLPQKHKDPGSFTIPCVVGNSEFKDALADLGAAINVMPKSVYKELGIGELKPTGLIVQLANRTTQRPEGLLEDVLVKVNDLIFPADFYVLDMANDSQVHQHTIILGRPFLKTAKTMIDVYKGTLTLRCGDMKVQFNLADATKHPPEDHSVLAIDVFDEFSVDLHHDFKCPNCDGMKSLCKECAEVDALLMNDEILENTCSTLLTPTSSPTTHPVTICNTPCSAYIFENAGIEPPIVVTVCVKKKKVWKRKKKRQAHSKPSIHVPYSPVTACEPNISFGFLGEGSDPFGCPLAHGDRKKPP